MINKKKLFLLFFICFATFLTAQIKPADKKFLAKIAMENQTYSEAINLLTQVLQVDNLDYESYFMRGYAKLLLNDSKGSLSDLKKAVELNSDYIQAYTVLGVAYARIYDYSSALINYENALVLDKKNANIYTNRAITYLNMKRYEDAILDCEKALYYGSKKTQLYLLKAIALIGLKKYNQAISQLDIIIESDSHNYEAIFRKALALGSQDSIVEAEKNLNFILHYQPKHLQALLYSSQLYLNQDSVSRALTNINIVLNNYPNSSLALFQKSLIFYKQNKLDSATKLLEKTVLLNSRNIKAWMLKSTINTELGRLEEALYDANKCIDIFPEYAQAYTQLFQIYYKQGKLKQALANQALAKKITEKVNAKSKRAYELATYNFDKVSHFKEINDKMDFSHISQKNYQLHDIFVITTIENKEKQFYFDFNLANDHIILPFESAGSFYKEVENTSFIKTLFEDDIKDSKSIKYVKKGLNQISAGDKELSIFSFNNAIEKDKKNYLAFFCRANIYIPLIIEQQNSVHPDYNLAINDYNKCIELNSKFYFSYFNRGVLYNREKKYLEAIADFSKVIEINPKFTPAYLNRAIIYLNLGNKYLACKDLRKVGEAGREEVYKYLYILCND